MKYLMFESFLFFCVICGILSCFAGLWFGNLPALTIGLVVGGLIPILLAELYASYGERKRK